MGFLESFFGAIAANEISEKKRAAREKENAEKKQLRDEISVIELEQDFLNYLISINCRNVSDFDEAISAKSLPGDTRQTKRTIDYYKGKLKEYIRLGGDPAYITEFEKMDLYIEIVSRLKEYGWLDKQEEYVMYADDTYFLDFDWKMAQKERHELDQISVLLNAPGNELKEVVKSSYYGFIPYDGHENAIVVDTAKSNDETIDSFLDFLTISAVFTDQYILIYNYEHNELYYKANVQWKDVETYWAEIPDSDWSLVEINGLSLLFNTEKVKEVVLFYGSHNVKVATAFRDQYNAAYEDINSLSGFEFEMVCKRLLENMGFDVETTKTTGDGGIDLIAYNHQPLLSGKYIIQCKRYTGSVGEPVIRDLYGVITSERANKGILMTSGVFTKQAQVFAEGKPIELIDGVKLRELLDGYYYI